MARRLRLEFPGAVYHVADYGDHRERVFHDDVDRIGFVHALGEVSAKAGWRVHAYCLLRDHFHLVVETPSPTLVAGMKWLLGTYTRRFNQRHRLSGHLFAGRYRSQLVAPEGGFFKRACDYVHLNPARAGILGHHEPLRLYTWSSFPSYLVVPSERPVWLFANRLLAEYGGLEETEQVRTSLERQVEELRRSFNAEDPAALRKSWCWGDAAFRGLMLARVQAMRGRHHFGPELAEATEAAAEGIVTAELGRLGWTERDLRTLRKGDQSKLRLAKRLRSETTMSLAWIARRLQMGARTYLAHLLYWDGRQKPNKGTGGRTPAVGERGKIRPMNLETAKLLTVEH